MINFRHPIYRTEYQERIISVYCYGDERLFAAHMNEQDGSPIGATPKLYASIDAAINVCKDLIDFIYGDVECYRERPLASLDSISAVYKNVPQPWYSTN